MALSLYDKMMLSQEDQQRILDITDAWGMATDQAEKDNLNKMAESIRAKYGYAGGKSGSGYTAVGLQIPQLGGFSGSSYDQYSSRIADVLSSIEDFGNFEWNPDEDAAYQSFLQQANRNAKQVFDNTIAGASVGTGGRPNSWAATVAAQSQGNILLDATSQMGAFEDRAYDKWNSERTYNLQELDALMGLDQQMYARYMDSYNAEVDMYNSAIQQKQSAIEQALERTELTGFVSNEDAAILGVAAGTPSQTAQERAWSLQEYLEKARIDARYDTSGGGGKSKTEKSNYTGSDIEYVLKVKDGETALTPQEVTMQLNKLYNQGELNDADYRKYMGMYGGVPMVDEARRLLDQKTQQSAIKAFIQTWNEQGKLTDDEAMQLISEYLE